MKNNSPVFAATALLMFLLMGWSVSTKVIAQETSTPETTDQQQTPPAESPSPAAPGDTPEAAPTAKEEQQPRATEASKPADASEASVIKPDYTSKGADTCLKCHDEDSKFPVLSVFKTKHAQPADARTPFAKLQCETCHGPGSEHAKSVPEGQKQAPINNFGAKSRLTAAQQNQICLDCHRGNDRMDWHSSAHKSGDLACANCHRVHVDHDPVLETNSQPEVCYQCHKKERADFLKPSKHPVRFGQIGCADCHSPHGSSTPAMLNQPTVNQTCYTCHADKRGPVLWEHAPVTEDCRICHTPHGSVHPSLLVKRPPLLCQQCHAQANHPRVPRDASGLPGASPSAFLLSGSCTNCHSQVHGSNHPSGVKLMR